jgi:hypothetical protein
MCPKSWGLGPRRTWNTACQRSQKCTTALIFHRINALKKRLARQKLVCFSEKFDYLNLCEFFSALHISGGNTRLVRSALESFRNMPPRLIFPIFDLVDANSIYHPASIGPFISNLEFVSSSSSFRRSPWLSQIYFPTGKKEGNNRFLYLLSGNIAGKSGLTKYTWCIRFFEKSTIIGRHLI